MSADPTATQADVGAELGKLEARLARLEDRPDTTTVGDVISELLALVRELRRVFPSAES